MAYLHGDVDHNEAEAACDFEYARECLVLREAAKLHKQGIGLHEIARRMNLRFSSSPFFLQGFWLKVFTCDFFPQSPWTSLDKHQREQFIKEEPTDSTNLLGLERILDSLKTMAAEMRAQGEKSRTTFLLHKGRRSYVLLPIDFGKQKKHALKMLAVLLEESQSKERFEKYSKKPFGEAKDRLKDLATWRLYRHCGNDWNKANDFADAHRKKTKKGAARPFYSAQQKQEEDSITGALLCSEQSGFFKAKQRMKAYSRKVLPWAYLKHDEKEMLRKAQAAIARAFAKSKAGRELRT